MNLLQSVSSYQTQQIVFLRYLTAVATGGSGSEPSSVQFSSNGNQKTEYYTVAESYQGGKYSS